MVFEEKLTYQEITSSLPDRSPDTVVEDDPGRSLTWVVEIEVPMEIVISVHRLVERALDQDYVSGEKETRGEL